MRCLPCSKLVPLLAVLFVGLESPEIEAQSRALEGVEAAVLELEEAINAAVDGLDCDAVSALTGRLEPLFVGNGLVVGTASDLHQVCEQMVAPRTGAEWDNLTRAANVLSADVAYVIREGDYTVHYRERESETVYLVMTTIWHRTGDGWRMVHLHESVRP